jgi:methylthioribulose-1-phosphate dehydratase
MTPRTFQALASALARTGREFHARGWALGTSGNFSAVVSRDPLRLAITASGLSKRDLGPHGVVQCDARGRLVEAPRGSGRSPRRKPAGRMRVSAETPLHLEIVRRRSAGAVLHTHSVWSTMLSERFAADGGVRIHGYEMLKGLAGVETHEHREWVPILENDQRMDRLAGLVGAVLARHEACHALLLRGHGLYTWGETLADAERHVEILEFLFEVMSRSMPGR